MAYKKLEKRVVKVFLLVKKSLREVHSHFTFTLVFYEKNKYLVFCASQDIRKIRAVNI